ncbi:MAG TPA: MBL fold metallo-hydrolase [Pseudonocardiaceae bacterium]
MEKITDGVWLLDGNPRHAYNVYLLHDVLVDAGSRFAERRILRQVSGGRVRAHVVTHGHPDHQGASHAVCSRLSIPLWCGDGDADAIERGRLDELITDSAIARWQVKHWGGPAHPVARRLREGDEVGDFTVLATPGHTPGSISLWREADRTLLVGDTLNRRPMVLGGGLGEPPADFCIDPDRNRAAIRRLAALEPATVCFGHGQPLRDPATFSAFANGLSTRVNRRTAARVR